MLECCFDDNTYLFGYDKVNRFKEDVIQSLVEILPKGGVGATQRVRVPFFELVATKGGTMDMLCQRMRKGRFPGSRSTGYHNDERFIQRAPPFCV